MTKTEAQTRADLIDKQLAEAGWDVNDPTQVVEEYDIEVELPDGVEKPRTRYEGHQFSDYVLLGRDGKPLAVVEAKKTSKDAALGVNRPSSIVAIFIKNKAASCRSVSMQMGTISIFGI